MALTPFQRRVCRLIARHRIAGGEQYVAGAAALNEVVGAPRLSRDIDLFHDTETALRASWAGDRDLLADAGYDISIVMERPSFVEAIASQDGESVLLQWVRDSAFRFFPLVTHEDFGLTLHPVDLATNKVLALVGRLEVRDWVDVMTAHDHIQRLGYLAWSACGKDPGFNPRSLLEHARRSGRYSAAEVAELSFSGAAPDAGTLNRAWHAILDEAEAIVAALPADRVGTCVIDRLGALVNLRPGEISAALADGDLRFHPGTIRGVLPTVR